MPFGVGQTGEDTGKNVISGAFGGAAIGTAIAPGVGTLIGAGAGGLTGLVSSLFGSSGSTKQVPKLSPQQQAVLKLLGDYLLQRMGPGGKEIAERQAATDYTQITGRPTPASGPAAYTMQNGGL